MDDQWQIYKKLAEDADAANNHAASEGFWSMAVLIAERAGEKNPRLAISLDRLGRSLLKQKKFVLAEAFLNRSWTIKHVLIPAPDSEKAITLNLLAELRFHQQNFPEAANICKQLFDIYSASFGVQDQRTLAIAKNLQTIQLIIQKTQEAAVAVPAPAPASTAAATMAASLKSNKLISAGNTIQRCERCGQPMAGDECFKCTGTSMKAISPLDKLT